MRFYVLIGPPGSGKGTLAEMLVRELNWHQLSTGNLCRKHIAQGTSLGQQIDFAIKSGKLVSDELIVDMVAQWIEQQPEGANIILDGFPRTVEQARSFMQMLGTQFSSAKLDVVRLNLADEAVIERLYGRAVCTNKDCQMVYSLAKGSSLAPKQDKICDKCSSLLERRADDTIETIKDRLATYYHHEKPLVNFYADHGRMVHELDVNKQLDQIFKDFTNVVGVEL